MSRRHYNAQGIYMRYTPEHVTVQREGFYGLADFNQQTRNTDSLKLSQQLNVTDINRDINDTTKLNKELRDTQVTDTDTSQDIKFKLNASTDTVLSTVNKTSLTDKSLENTIIDSKNILTNLMTCDISIDAAQSIHDKLIIDRSKQLNLNVSQLVGVIGNDNEVDDVVLSNIVSSIGDKTKRDCVQEVVNKVDAQNKLMAEEAEKKQGDTITAGKSATGAANVDTSRTNEMKADNTSKSAFDIADFFAGLANFGFVTESKQESEQTGQVTSRQEKSGNGGFCTIL